MKTNSVLKKLSVLALTGLLLSSGLARADWDDHRGYRRDYYDHDRGRYWDHHGGWHDVYFYHRHHGYWARRDDGVRFFINVD